MIRAISAVFLAPILAGCSEKRETTVQEQKHYVGAPREEEEQDSRCKGGMASLQPEGGAIPTEEFAKTLAMLYLDSLFWKGATKDELPLQATIENGVWHVRGTLPEGYIGGVKHIEMCRSNGRIVNYYGEQ